jgi:hypothetical protein
MPTIKLHGAPALIEAKRTYDAAEAFRSRAKLRKPRKAGTGPHAIDPQTMKAVR